MRNQSAKCNQTLTLGSELTKIQLVNYVLCATPKKIVVLSILFFALGNKILSAAVVLI